MKCICCDGNLEIFSLNTSYLKCNSCGSYRIKEFPSVEWFKKFYDLDFYWRKHQTDIGNPVIEKRRATDIADGRLDSWWTVLSEFIKDKRGTILEVGCAHAAFLEYLLTKGFRQAVGIEISRDVSEWVINNVPGIDMRTGIFPDIEVNQCDLFVATDVLEHVLDPVRFIEGIMRVLRPGGFSFVQVPIDEGLNPPFGHAFFKLFFESHEHLWIFSRIGISNIFKNAGFEIISNDRKWRVGHEIIIAKKG